MKTDKFTVSGFEFPVLVTHEDGWKGKVTIEWSDPLTKRHHLVEIPAEVLLHLSIRKTKEWVLAELADAIDKLKGDP